MAKTFYLRLAAGNLWRSKRMYGPYCVASAMMSGIFFIILNLVFSRSIQNMSYGGTVIAMFVMGIVVMTLLTIGYMLYINSFLIKRRKKEFGLYGVLGMEQRHVTRVILFESIMVSYGSLLLGLVAGAVFGRLAFLILMHVLKTAPGSVYTLTWEAFLTTFVIFSVIFFLSVLYNLRQVRLANPIDLLKGEQKGEKKVRFALPMTILGFGLLGLAYYIAITTTNPGEALMQFWPAVLLVIIATWLLFTGGSVFILGRMQKNKRLYYRPSNFITISGMQHRLKQNAAGLANICILSSTVIVTISVCCALYLGSESIAHETNPHDVQFTVRSENTAAEEAIFAATREAAYTLAEQEGVSVDHIYEYRHYQQNVMLADGKLVYVDENGKLPYDEATASASDFYGMYVVPLEDFNGVMGSEYTLGPGEVILATSDPKLSLAAVPAGNTQLSVREIITDSPFTKGKNSEIQQRLYVIAPNEQVADALKYALAPDMETHRYTHVQLIDVDAEQEAGYAYTAALRDVLINITKDERAKVDIPIAYTQTDIFNSRYDGQVFYGGFLFLGVFFALLFLTNTVLILYFKQVSEGYDDRERFVILQKVGLSTQEVKRTISRQILIVFLLPLMMALLHMAAVSPMLQNMLGSFRLTDFRLTLTCILITSLLFIIVYLGVYRLTARVYYRLVKW